MPGREGYEGLSREFMGEIMGEVVKIGSDPLNASTSGDRVVIPFSISRVECRQ